MADGVDQDFFGKDFKIDDITEPTHDSPADVGSFGSVLVSRERFGHVGNTLQGLLQENLKGIADARGVYLLRRRLLQKFRP